MPCQGSYLCPAVLADPTHAGTLLPPLSWPLLGWCTWLAVLRLRLRLNASDKKQAAVGLLSSVGLLLFLVQDTEFAGWGESSWPVAL